MDTWSVLKKYILSFALPIIAVTFVCEFAFVPGNMINTWLG